MPHCIIEITKGVLTNIDLTQFMIEISQAINTDRIFESDDIKTRVYKIDDSLMGEIKQDHSFVTTEIILLDNKTEIQKQRILDGVQEVLISYFGNIASKFSITSRLTLVNPDYYKKQVNY
jgi:5-carboxymethyl-2-hydroxymuconate isomerase